MLDTDTKRRIDTARDILVGKVPDPKSQVEQITIALIYKFMNDMDAEAEELGGERKFFGGEYRRYSWPKLMRSGLGGHETLNLYAEAIAKMPENPGIPPLFRDIFKNAFLPYRDPETLRAFLKIIDEFEYDHSERLGDAFEYLLSVLGSQGDAGQFRTPRHIIDFIVAIIHPKKHETVLDPACGTAGFLISAWKHILRANSAPDAVDKQAPAGNGKASLDSSNISPARGDLLTPDERGRLAANVKGYDISPDMVRLSLVNMYLHGFTDPHIYEYDPLTSQDRWNEYADVILANPPFMSPKGGIRPHNRFSVQSKRSEVLFVDYIAEHLTPNGRAGIIVPEGVVFQSQHAYTQLRKMLVDDCLVAIISLPAGVFNPYSGVKTSILILDKVLAKHANTIAFFKIDNDGFNLGAQRRLIDKDDLPQARTEIAEYLRRLRARESVENFEPSLGLVVPKARIAENGEYTLRGERYRENGQRTSHLPHVKLSDIAEIAAGNPAPQGDGYYKDGELSFIRTSDVGAAHLSSHFIGSVDRVNQVAISELGLRIFPAGTILLPKSGASTFLNHRVVLGEAACVSSHLACIICNDARALPLYVYHVLRHVDARHITPDQAYPSLRLADIGSIEIPLPPLNVQREITAEIEGYQKVIDSARAIIDNYCPYIPIDPDWPIVRLGEICSFKNGLNFRTGLSGYTVKIIGVGDFQSNLYAPLNDLEVVHLDAPLADDYLLKGGDLLFVRSNGNPDLVGRSIIVPSTDEPITFSGFTIRCRIHDERALPIFFARLFKSRDFSDMIKTVGRGANIRNLSQSTLAELTVPLPPSTVQHAIVAEIEAEQALVDANRQLIARFEKKIQGALARVWGEEEHARVGA